MFATPLLDAPHPGRADAEEIGDLLHLHRAVARREDTITQILRIRDGQAIALTQRYAALAVNTLAQVMMNSGASSSARVSAASALLKFGREGIELDDPAARIEALERTVNDDRGRSWRR